jgi:hypothetical protein
MCRDQLWAHSPSTDTLLSEHVVPHSGSDQSSMRAKEHVDRHQNGPLYAGKGGMALLCNPKPWADSSSLKHRLTQCYV